MRRMLLLALVTLVMGSVALANLGGYALDYSAVVGDTLAQIKGFKPNDDLKANQKIATVSIKKGKLKDAAELLIESDKLFEKDLSRALERGLDLAVNGGPGAKANQDALDLLMLARAQSNMALGFVYRKLGSEAKAAKVFQKVISSTDTKKRATKEAAVQAVQIAKAQLKEMGF